jgi:hypothetical protein
MQYNNETRKIIIYILKVSLIYKGCQGEGPFTLDGRDDDGIKRLLQ